MTSRPVITKTIANELRGMIETTPWHEQPKEVTWSDRSVSGCRYGWDDLGYYVIVGFNLPEGVLAEIDDGTYGTLQGIRYYYEPAEDRPF